MPQTLLASLALAYQPLWSPTCDLAGIRLRLHEVPAGHVDAPHLLQTLRSFWPHRNSSLILSPGSPGLLCALLRSGQDYSPGLEIQHDWLDDPTVAELTLSAFERGLHLIWRGPNKHVPAPEFAHCFRRQLLAWDEEDSVQALLAARNSDIKTSGQRPLQAVISAIEQDASLEVLEILLTHDPILTYRFLRHVNTLPRASSSGIDTLQRGLMVMGITALKNWCTEQLATSNTDSSLTPVRGEIRLRAHVCEHLIDAGGESNLRHEMYLTSLFAQLDLLLGEPLDHLLGQLPLPSRIVQAVCHGSGDYAPYLRLSAALQAMDATPIPALCADFGMTLDDVNRALLRALGSTAFRPVG